MAKRKAIPWLLVAAAAAAVWWLFFREKDAAAAKLADDVAHGKMVPIPAFGTDQIIDAADAIASETLTLPGPNARNSSQ